MIVWGAFFVVFHQLSPEFELTLPHGIRPVFHFHFQHFSQSLGDFGYQNFGYQNSSRTDAAQPRRPDHVQLVVDFSDPVQAKYQRPERMLQSVRGDASADLYYTGGTFAGDFTEIKRVGTVLVDPSLDRHFNGMVRLPPSLFTIGRRNRVEK